MLMLQGHGVDVQMEDRATPGPRSWGGDGQQGVGEFTVRRCVQGYAGVRGPGIL